jgi:hypothetical protein
VSAFASRQALPSGEAMSSRPRTKTVGMSAMRSSRPVIASGSRKPLLPKKCVTRRANPSRKSGVWKRPLGRGCPARVARRSSHAHQARAAAPHCVASGP